MSERILMVEDEANIASFVSAYLEKAGYAVDRAVTGAEAKDKALSCRARADLARPQSARHRRARGLPAVRATSQVPILMLTARDDDVDKIVGLEVGADDYVTKPFNPRELVARIRTILRRATAPPPVSKGRRTHGAISIDAGRREVTVDGAPMQLAPKEFDLFWELLDHSGLVLTRDQLLERVWGYTFAGDTRTVDVHVRQLRRKIGETCPVVTVWGVGYKVADDASAVS